MTMAAFICSAELSMSINIGLIDSFAARLTSRISASVFTHYADVTPLANRCYVSSHTLAPKNHSKANHERPTNAETLSHRRKKSVQLTLKLAQLCLTWKMQGSTSPLRAGPSHQRSFT